MIKQIKKTILILIIVSFIWPVFAGIAKEQPPITPPETLQKSGEIGEKMVESAGQKIPNIIKKIFYQEILPLWQKMSRWFETHFWLKIVNWFKTKIKPIIKERIGIFKERFPEEKKELKQEIKTESNNWWQKLKDFFK